MALKITPVELRNGALRVNWPQLVVWTLLLNAGLLLWIKYQVGPIRHPVTVTAKSAVVFSLATDTARASVAVETVYAGGTVDLHTVQADGWCRVSLPEQGYPRRQGYVQRRFLLIPDSTLLAAQKGPLR
ncbi:hypothetical protein [Hymenobacter algoricola]|uniref:SH3 domain-containing protein n=1 Tax=Hymenobacter algoricola TaxID=486267 RepID=A0ABP7N4Y0_9BACT